MNKGLDKVRKSIIRRNKMRNLQVNRHRVDKEIPIFPQVEEGHGFISSHPNHLSKGKETSSMFSHLFIKGILSLMLFFGVFLLFQSDNGLLAKPKIWTSHLMTEEFPFARVHQWYQQTFGTPLALSPESEQVVGKTESFALPVTGNITQTFEENGSGIMITPKGTAPVLAWLDGVIIFAGNDRDKEKTVIVQHADMSKSTYAFLSTVDVHLYQFISAGERIGTFNPTETAETVYFSIEKDNEYIDPIRVINVDDIP